MSDRRLAAILAADVVGYSRLVGADEVAALAALRACEADVVVPAVAAHGGRIFKRLGDGYLVEFSSVVSCVACALAWQEGAHAPITFRIGIHLGDVIVEGDDLLGDGVNIAARLEGIADPGGICLSDDAQRQLRGKLAFEIEDIGIPDLKNIETPIRAFRLRRGGAPGAAARAPVPGAWHEPRILLVPFRHHGGEGEMLAGGVTDSVAQALAAFDAFQLIDPGVGAEGIASEGAVPTGRRLGARYIVEGSVQTTGTRARVRVNLTDTESGRRVWADSFDRSAEDAFALEDDITAIVASVVGEAVEAELARSIEGKADPELTPYETFVRALQHLHRMNADDNLVARAMLERLIAGGFNSLRVRIVLCWTYTLEKTNGWPRTCEDHIARCFEILGDAQRHHDRAPSLHRLLARLHDINGEEQKAIAHIERAVALNPWDSDIIANQAIVELRHGRLERAIELYERAIRINPYAPPYYRSYMAILLFLAGRPQEGLDCIAMVEGSVGPSRIARIVNLVALGREAAARDEGTELLRENPGFTIRGYLERGALFDREGTAGPIRDALGRAGLPEGAP